MDLVEACEVDRHPRRLASGRQWVAQWGFRAALTSLAGTRVHLRTRGATDQRVSVAECRGCVVLLNLEEMEQ